MSGRVFALATDRVRVVSPARLGSDDPFSSTEGCSMFALERLESRQHFSAAPVVGDPDLSAVMTGHLPKVLLAGARIVPTVKITNAGGALAASELTANVYVSTTPNVDGSA